MSVTCSEPIIQLRQLNAHLARPEDRTERLLHDQAQPPSRQQRVERPRVETADERPLDEQPQRAGGA